jgi:Leucine-rich repeat (LRR) protein
MKKLRVLYIQYNMLGSLPKSLLGVSTIEEIYASDNQIKILPDVLEARQLKILNLAANPIVDPERIRIRKALSGCRIDFKSR